jgi:hypothetical protein
MPAASTNLLKKGARVRFRAKVFRPPWSPHYDEYRGHLFVIEAFKHSRSHLQLRCLSDPTIVMKGLVHPDEVKLAARGPRRK